MKDYFAEGSPYLSHPLLTSERAVAEVDQLERLVGSVSGRVLDVGCGFGRHCIELASRGSDATGIDRSPAMISAARERSIAASQFADFICIEAAELHEVARYDLAVCLFGAFGQLTAATTDDAPHANLLRQTKQALRPGATLVVELADRERTVEAFEAMEQVGSTTVTRRFNSRTSIMTEQAVVANGDVYVQRCRLFDTTELVDMVHDVGLDVQQVISGGLAPGEKAATTLIATRPS